MKRNETVSKNVICVTPGNFNNALLTFLFFLYIFFSIYRSQTVTLNLYFMKDVYSKLIDYLPNTLVEHSSIAQTSTSFIFFQFCENTSWLSKQRDNQHYVRKILPLTGKKWWTAPFQLRGRFYINVRMRENRVDMRFLMHETVISLADIDK